MKSMRIFNHHNLTLRAVLTRSFVVAVLAAACSGLTGCATVASTSISGINPAHTTSVTGRVLTDNEIRATNIGAILGDNNYAEVNSAWLREFNTQFQAELSRLGITHWDARFDCNRFADLYRALAQAHYFRDSFHSYNKGEALAIASMWYVQDDTGTRHAIIQAFTERGRVFIEPQTGKEMKLTQREVQSTYFLAM